MRAHDRFEAGVERLEAQDDLIAGQRVKIIAQSMPAALQIHRGVQEQTRRHNSADEQKYEFFGRELGEVSQIFDLVRDLFGHFTFQALPVIKRQLNGVRLRK